MKKKKMKKLWKKARKAGHAVVMDKKGRVLIVKARKDGRWTLPGGQLDKGESGEQGAAREVQEETGIKAKFGKWVQTAKYGAGKIGRVFKAFAKRAKVKLSPEHIKARWVSVKKAARKCIARHAGAILALA